MRPFGDLEATIMERLWSWDRAATVREVLEDLQCERSLAYTTVMTVMDNLHRKGVLTRELDGRAYRYRPVRSREDHIARVMAEALESGGDRAAVLVRFVEQMSPEEAAQLQELLRATRKGSTRQ